jgi:hypothetical protein
MRNMMLKQVTVASPEMPARSNLKSKLLCNLRFTANQFVLAPSPLTLTAIFYFQLNPCVHSPYVTSSLTREWICRLQLLLALANTVNLGSVSRGTHVHILLSQIRDSPNMEGQVPVFISQLNPPGTGFPFRSLLRLAGLRWRYSNPPPHGMKCLPETPVIIMP